MGIDKNSSLPVYLQLKDIILKKIQSKELLPGQMIPSERQLADEMNISRMTVRQTFKLLENEGKLYREKGKGTFVTRPLFEQKNIMSFTEFVKGKGFIPSTKVLCFDIIEPPKIVQNVFSIHGENLVYHFKRLRSADSLPIAIEEVFIPEKSCPKLMQNDIEGSLYKLLKEKYKYTITGVDSMITSLMPGSDQKALLNIKENIPLLAVSSINYDQNGRKIYYESSYYRSDEFKYSIHVNIY